MEALDLTVQAAAVASFAKVLVDVTKKSVDSAAGKVLPVLAFIYSEIIAFLLFLSGDGIISRQTISVTILTGILGTGGAVIVTEIQKAARTEEEKNENS